MYYTYMYVCEAKVTAIGATAAKGGEVAISKEEGLYRSLASCGAVLIAFIGVAHEVVGHILFPWGPAFLGGPLGWHGTGLLAIASGLLLLGGTLRLFRFPVVPFALSVAAAGAFFVIVTAVLHHQFHMFALVGCSSGVVTAHFHRKAARQGAPAAASGYVQ